jgi:inorganic pyrophosphatase
MSLDCSHDNFMIIYQRGRRRCVPGCVVRAQIIGAIQARQKEKGGDWTRNDRLLALATQSQTHQKIKNLSDLRPHLLREIKGFFVDYNKMRNRKFKADGDCGPRHARALVEAGMKAFAKKRRKAA